jgi:hypothetical protein
MGDMTSAHLIFIPGVLVVGIVIGWVLGSRAAQDAFAAELRRREERARKREGAKQRAGDNSQIPPSNSPREPLV